MAAPPRPAPDRARSAPTPRLRPLHELPPPQAWQRLQRLRRRLDQRPERGPFELLLADALSHLSTLLAARSWLRHDPGCDHRSPRGTGPTRCTCGLSATLRARPDPDAGPPPPRTPPGADQSS